MLNSSLSSLERHRKQIPQPSKFWHQPASLLLIALLAIIAPLVPTQFHNRRWHGLQSLIVEFGMVLLLAGVLNQRWSATALRGWIKWACRWPQMLLVLFLTWEIISALHSPDWRFVFQELLPTVGGGLVAWIVAAQLRGTQQLQVLLDGLIGAALLVPLVGFVLYGSNEASWKLGTFNDHRLFGTFLLSLIPVSLAVSLSLTNPMRKMFAQGALTICLTALIIAQTRSAWIGAGVAFGTFGLLTIHADNPLMIMPGNWNRIGVLKARITLLMLIVAAVLSFWLLPNRDEILKRVNTVTTIAEGKDTSTDWRLTVWKGAVTMIEQKPILGWGTGGFALKHQQFTQTGHPTTEVLRNGPSLEDEAHNSYLQLSVDTGLPGLLLWIGLLISMFITGLNAIRRYRPKSLEQYALIGSLAAIAGQSVDALSNPAWQFGHIALYFWIIIGIILALSAPRSLGPVTVSHTQDTGNRFQTGLGLVLRLCFSLALCALLLRFMILSAFALPAPHL